MKSIFLVLCISCFTSILSAANVCISNGQEHALYQREIPTLFRKLPVKLGGERSGIFYDVLAVIKINIQSDVIVLSTDSWQGPLGHYKDVVEVKNVCFNSENKEMVISFNNNAKDFKGQYADDAVTLPEIVLKAITTSQEKVLIEKIYRKVGPASRPLQEEVNQ